MAERTLRAAVIGSGFGGIAAAARLQAMGVQTTLFEARDKPGGRAYVWRDQGFTFDAGPTVITAPQTLEEVFSFGGKRLADYVDLLPVEPFYRLEWADGDSFDYSGDGARLMEQIRARGDEAGYGKFLEYSKSCFEEGYEKRVDMAFLRFRSMLKAAPALALVQSHKSVYDIVSMYIKDEHLRQAFSFHALLIGGNPMDTSALYALIHYLERKWGVFFARGGTGALVQGMIQLFEDLGGEVRLNTPVHHVRVEQRGKDTVHLVNTTEHATEPFDLVVSNADLHHTYGRLYDGAPGARDTRRRLERMKWSMSLYVLYFGTDRRYEDVAHHTVVFGPRYEGLLTDIFDGGRLADDFSLYLHAPTRTDPSMAPDGCEAFYVLSPVPHLGNARLPWKDIGPGYGDRILESLERRLLPDLRKHIVTRREFTPLDFESELNAFQGSAFSVAPVLTQSAWFRPHNRDKKIPGLYIVGAGTHPGAGVPGVISSAKATTGVIAEDFGLDARGRLPAQ
jgi:phytoene desaturase